jgi:predicted acyltransferase
MAAEILKFEKREMAKVEAPKAKRFEALDILRGLFIIGMLLANNAGDWSHIWGPFDHAEWHGFTMTDLVFPGFMVCVGISMTLSMSRRIGAGGKKEMALHVVRRAAILIAIGLFLNLLPNFDFGHWRYPGVLQRIGLCYGLAAGLVFLHSHIADGKLVLHARPLAFWALGLILGYAILLKFVPVPGFGANRFDPEGSWPAYIDRIIPGIQHIYQGGVNEAGQVVYDPEGLLSTFPAMFNILAGLLIGLLIQKQTPAKAVGGVALAGLMLVLAALALDGQIPIIKKLWTSSFALLTSGLAMLILSALMLVMDRFGYTKWAMPIRVFGTNAILAYVFAWLFSVFLDISGLSRMATIWILGVVHDPYFMSFLFALGVLLICWLFVLPFYLKKIFLKI